jgi:uncharacterized protein (DUF488 family)
LYGKKVTIMNCYTIGHSNHSAEKFEQLLAVHEINCVIDVRSAPYSKYVVHFNRENIEKSLKEKNILYIYMGKELGARQTDPCVMADGRVDYDKVAKSKIFLREIDRVIDGIRKGFKIVLMCAEKDPLDCHRFALISRVLSGKGIEINHILDDGRVISNRSMEDGLVAGGQGDLFFGALAGAGSGVLETEYKKLTDALSERVSKTAKNGG